MRIRTLIPNEGYEVAWTRKRKYFNALGAQGTTDVMAAALADAGINPEEATTQYEWLSRAAALFIPANIALGQPLLLADNYRNLLIFQNVSMQNATTDVLPNLLIAYDGPVVPLANAPSSAGAQSIALNGITLLPGVSLLLDTRIATNSIYVAWGQSTGGGVTAGHCSYGRTPNSPPLDPLSIARLQQYIYGPRNPLAFGQGAPGFGG